ncbi:uncharacterized protein LOC129849281 isoform X1 [Salvelinus fontinalis]|uniref:uncharacterized protein LOC129849281 isoform X1 n=1 Tax=Salvelinus fontinalis TaxID=8038 RepID=UPI0024855A0D|nr:uncharacterized protein LOC129849281 isoform X1 [Salvelinus fontinalis]
MEGKFALTPSLLTAGLVKVGRRTCCLRRGRFLCLYLTTKRVEDIALRLVSLRQTITTLLGSTLSRNHLFVAGKVLLGALVRANHMDEAKFIRTYNDFVDYLSDPSKRNDTERELAEAKIHHVNMIDVLFELVLFGMMTAQKSLMVHAGGFVEDLYALLYSFLPTAANMEPEADRYLLLLNDYCDTLPPKRDLDTNALHYFALNLKCLNSLSGKEQVSSMFCIISVCSNLVQYKVYH